MGSNIAAHLSVTVGLIPDWNNLEHKMTIGV